jgi:tetratricopeptide (TPR) repeat protein
MTLFLAALAAATAAEPDSKAMRFSDCVALASTNPSKALDEASAWRIAGGGVLARQCTGLAYAALNRWQSAALAFEQAAKASEADGDGRSARLWVLAGNAALAGNDAAKARAYFDSALASAILKGGEAGEAHLDRARARFAANDTKSARVDLDVALKLVPADPLVWLLSATLARKDGELKRAQTDIIEATKRAPDDASVANEAGNIAMMSGAEEEARASWTEAVKLKPDSPAGKAAAAALAQLPPKSGAAPKP